MFSEYNQINKNIKMEIFDVVLKDFHSITSKPENFLSVQDDEAETVKRILKKLYDFLKLEERHYSFKPSGTLPELIVDNCDEEQIWQQIVLQHEGTFNRMVEDVAFLLAKENRAKVEVDNTPEDEDDDLSETNFNDGDEDGDEENEDPEPAPKFRSELDDEFFKMSEMETFCDEMEKEEKSLGMNLFVDDEQGENDEEPELIRYKDFFGKPKKVKNVKFAEEEDLEDVEDEDFDMEEGNKEDEDQDGVKSSFQERQERLKARIESLENEAIREKPWHLKGEVTSTNRPVNSLLEEYVEFDRAARPAPVFTEKTTLRLEDIIKQRVKDKAWDDVIRKVKPVEDIREYRKRLVLDQEKSKISLAEIYEQEFIKQREAVASITNKEITEDVEPPEHIEIKKMMKNLFIKLDALSNFHYTPKQVTPEVKIVSNLPAITMEDVAPVATSEAALLAPEEVKNKPKGELMSKDERTVTDKKRERRNKKLKQRLREKEKAKKEKVLNKMSLGLGNKYSKEKAEKTLEKLTKDKNVDKMVEVQSKPLRSSSAFFNKLQDEVKGQIKKKGTDGGEKKRKKILEKISAKKIKL